MLRSIGKQSGESVESVTACSVHLSPYVLFVPHFNGYKSLNFKRFCFSDVNAILISLSFSSARDAASVRFVPSVRKPMCGTMAVEHSASRHLPAISWQYQYPSHQFPFHLSTGLRPVYFIICTFSIHASAYSLVVRHCSESSQRRYREMKCKLDHCLQWNTRA